MEDVLVSVVVFSYRSSSTIIGTLNSIFQQTYPRLELIITDDCSLDDTIDVVEQWINENKDRFENVVINTHNVNVGVTQNMIDSFQHVHGEWLKIIGGDDLLLQDCISSNLEYIRNSCEDIKFLFTNMMCFNDTEEWLQINALSKKLMKRWNNKSLIAQKKAILRKNLGLAPSTFFYFEVYKNLTVDFNVCRNVEDWPFHIAVIHSGNKIYYRDEVTVLYRKHNSSSFTKGVAYYNERMVESDKVIKQNLCYPRIPKYHIGYWWNQILNTLRERMLQKFFHNKTSFAGNVADFMINCFYLDGWKRNILKVWKI